MAATSTPTKRAALLCIDTFENKNFEGVVPAIATKLSSPRSELKKKTDWEERTLAAETRRSSILSAKKAKAHVEKRTPTASPYGKEETENKLTAAEVRRTANLALVIAKAKVKEVSRPSEKTLTKADLEAKQFEHSTRREADLEAKKAKAAVAKKTPPPSPFSTEVMERKMAEAERRRSEHLETVKAKASPREVSPSTTSRQTEEELVEKLQSAEIRRDMEIESIRYKAQQSSARKTNPKKGADKAKALEAKLEAAATRRTVQLDARKSFATKKSHSGSDDAASSSSSSEEQKGMAAPRSPTRKSIEEKLSSASARKQSLLAKKVETAAALGTDRIDTMPQRIAEEEEAFCVSKRIALEAKLESAAKRHEGATDESLTFARQDVQRVELAAKARNAESETKEQALESKQQHAEELRLESSRSTAERLAVENAKLDKAKATREAKDSAMAEHLMAKEVAAAQRGDDRKHEVAKKAASFGSTSVITAEKRRAADEAAKATFNAVQLESKLQHAAENHKQVLTDKQAKAANFNVKVVEVTQNNLLQDTEAGAATQEKLKSAAKRYEEAKQAKAQKAKQLGSDRVDQARLNRSSSNDNNIENADASSSAGTKIAKGAVAAVCAGVAGVVISNLI